MARGWHGRRERRWLAPGGDGSQLDRRVRPVPGDHRLVGKSPEGSRQGRGVLRGPQPLRAVLAVSSHIHFGVSEQERRGLTVSARTAVSRRLADGLVSICVSIQGSGPVWSRTPSALQSSTIRDRSADDLAEGRVSLSPSARSGLCDPDRKRPDTATPRHTCGAYSPQMTSSRISLNRSGRLLNPSAYRRLRVDMTLAVPVV